jgi:hypothetical protein
LLGPVCATPSTCVALRCVASARDGGTSIIAARSPHLTHSNGYALEWRPLAHLAVDERGDGEVPRRVGGHAEPQEGPHPVVVEGRDEHRGGAARAEDVRPCPLVQPVVDVVDVAAKNKLDSSSSRRTRKQEEAIDRPGASDQLDDGAEEQERAVEGETGRLPVRAQQPVQHFEPLVNMIESLPLA